MPGASSPSAPRGVPWRVMLPAALGNGANGINTSMMAVGLVPIAEAFSAGGEVVWLVSAFYLASAVVLPLAGILVDRVGPCAVLVAGMLLLAAGGGLAVFATNLAWLIVARVVIAIGTASAYPAGVTMVREFTPGSAPGAGARGLRVLVFASQGTVMLGPVLGGLLLALGGWQALFLINVPIGIVAVLLALLGVPRRPRVRTAPVPGARPDVLSLLLFAAFLITALSGLMELPSAGAWWALAAAVVLGALLVLVDLRSRRPVVDLRFLAAHGDIARTLGRQFLIMLLLYTLLYGFPVWLEFAHGLDSAQIGLILLPISGAGLLTTALAVRAIHRWGARGVLLLGAGALVAGSAALLLLTENSLLAVIIAIACLLGLPNGFLMLGNQSRLFDQSPAERIGALSGLLRTSQFVGGTVSMVVVGVIFEQPSADAGLHLMAIVMIGLGALLVGELVWPSRDPRANSTA